MHGVVAAGNPHTARAAAEVLRAGGNAVDAVVAAGLATFVAEPLLSSAGGAGMMTVALEGRAPAAVDFFSTAPGLGAAPAEGPEFVAVEVDFGSATQIFHVGRGSAAVPLALDGLVTASRTFGCMPLHDVVQPAVRMAREGVPLSEGGAHVFRILWPILARDPETMRVVARGDRPPAAGTPLVNGALSALLAEVGREGAVPERFREALLDAFGPSSGGLLCRADLEASHVEVVPPLRIALGAWEAFTSPRVGGRLVASIVGELARTEPEADEAREVARMAEASHHAHLERAALTAPGSTTHISVVDAAGGAAALTLTNGEGSGHLIPGTGSQLNNFLGEEDLNPHGYHLHAPGARLPTMVAPTIALHHGVPVLALGSGGSNRIRSSVGQVLYRVAVRGESLEDAVGAPRVHAEVDAAWLELEGLREPDRAVRALEGRFARVHPFARRDFFFGGVHAVLRRDDGTLAAIGDGRRGGAAERV